MIVGLDLSLTSTGWARLDDGGVEVGRIKSKGAQGASLADRAGRLAEIADQVMEVVTDSCAWNADLVLVEAPAQNQTTGHHHDRSGLWWLVVGLVMDLGRPVVEVSPTSLKKYATGKGNAGKDQVLAAVVRRYADVDVAGNDEADALVLAAMGARHMGCPIDDMPALNLTAMGGVRWPAVVA